MRKLFHLLIAGMLILSGSFLLLSGSCTSLNSSENSDSTINRFESDVCVYGATEAGIAAAIAVAREGYTVTIIEPTHKIGGLLGTGFRISQDVPYPDCQGGLAREFFLKDISLTPRYQQGVQNNVKLFQFMMAEYMSLIRIITNHRLASVTTSGGKITEAFFEYAPPGKYGVPVPFRISDTLIKVNSKIYIDASYEGDLMAYSGVPNRLGRESRDEYGESFAGTILSKTFPGVDPYKEEGNPRSGLLSCIPPDPLGKEGDSSRFFMVINFKLAWETNPSEEFPGILITPPETKNEDLYELLRRYVKAGYKFTWPHENYAREELISGFLPGQQIGYLDGDWATRSRLYKGYVDHVRALTDFSGKEVRLVSGVNDDTDGWGVLYYRTSRRMIGEYVFTQHDMQLQTDPPTPIGMNYYKLDIYPSRLVVLDDGTLASEGNIWERISPGPWQIPYGVIIPKKEDCKNLLVPVCMSATHIGYSALRRPIVRMTVGESAGIAAAIALKTRKAVQDINRDDLTSQLKKYGQKLEWDGLGYRMWRHSIFSRVVPETPPSPGGSIYSFDVPRWQTHPEEYTVHPVETLWK